MTATVSIVIVCSDQAKPLLDETLDACLASTYERLEILVIDTGRAEGGSYLTRIPGYRRPKTRMLLHSGKTALRARNDAVKEASGAYVLHLDAGDRIHPHYVEKAVRILDTHPNIGYVTPGCRTFGVHEAEYLPGSIQLGDLTLSNPIAMASLIRREAWNQAQGCEESFQEGFAFWDLWLKLAKLGWSNGMLREPLWLRRLADHPGTRAMEAEDDEPYRALRLKHPELFEADAWYRLLCRHYGSEVQARDALRSTAPDSFSFDPIVSVVIPCYNYGSYVVEAVDSCLASTFQELEVVVVNNGSTDPETNMILKLLKRPKTRVVHVEQNQGLPHGRNVGVAAAKGRYILPLDADDMIHPTLIEKAYRILETQPEAGFVTPGLEYFGDAQWRWIPPLFDRDRLLRENIVCVCSLFRKAAWESAGGYNERMLDGYEDWDFWISLTERGWTGAVIEEPLLLYRRHSRNMSTESGKRHESIVSQIRANHPGLYA